MFYMTIFSLSLFFSQESQWDRLLDLRGQWRFEIGDDMRWADPDFNDKDWDEIFVPSSWEEEGFHGYDGFAWYRKTFRLSTELQGNAIYLHLGFIDDVDEVYVNGNFIGFSGRFPPDYQTAYNQYRTYYIPQSILSFTGENVIAVRVYDDDISGGIMEGKIGFYTPTDFLYPDMDLSGVWKFIIGDNLEWSEEDLDDRNWEELLVPGFWETQGLKDYDGFGWYRISFEIPEEYEDKDLVLLLGKIDDIDETYLNGFRLGHTGRMNTFSGNISLYNEYQKFRAYEIPKKFLNISGKNILAVRVYDGLMHGGIYDGPIGIVSQERYDRWFQRQRKKKSLWDIFDFHE